MKFHLQSQHWALSAPMKTIETAVPWKRLVTNSSIPWMRLWGWWLRDQRKKKKKHHLHTSEQTPQYSLVMDVLEYKTFPYVNNIHMLYWIWQYCRQMAHSLCLGSCHVFKQLFSLSLKTLTFLALVLPPNFDIILFHILRSLAYRV